MHREIRDSEKTAYNSGYENMRKREIQKRIEELKDERCERTQIDADYVLMRLVETDQLDILDIVNSDMSFKPLIEWPKVWRQSISAMDIAEISAGDNVSSVVRKIKWPDKVKNIELIGKHVDVGAFKDRLEVSGNLGLSERVKKARERSGK